MLHCYLTNLRIDNLLSADESQWNGLSQCCPWLELFKWLLCFNNSELQWMFIILYNVSWRYSGWIHKLCYLGMDFLKVLKLTSCLVKRNGHINNKSNYACHLIPILRVTLRFKLLHVQIARFSTKLKSLFQTSKP